MPLFPYFKIKEMSLMGFKVKIPEIMKERGFSIIPLNRVITIHGYNISY